MRFYIHEHDVIAYTGAKLTTLDTINFVMLYTVCLSEIFHMYPMVTVIHENKCLTNFIFLKKIIVHMTYLDVYLLYTCIHIFLIKILRVITLF